MDTHERELREDRLGRSVRAALFAESAPAAWVRDALAAPGRAAVALPARTRAAVPAAGRAAAIVLPREESRLSILLPHLLGVALLVGLVLAVALRPDLRAALDRLMAPLFATRTLEVKAPEIDVPRLMPWLMAMVPVLVALFAEATRAFSTVRRWFS